MTTMFKGEAAEQVEADFPGFEYIYDAPEPNRRIDLDPLLDNTHQSYRELSDKDFWIKAMNICFCWCHIRAIKLGLTPDMFQDGVIDELARDFTRERVKVAMEMDRRAKIVFGADGTMESDKNDSTDVAFTKVALLMIGCWNDHLPKSMTMRTRLSPALCWDYGILFSHRFTGSVFGRIKFDLTDEKAYQWAVDKGLVLSLIKEMEDKIDKR